MPRVHQKFRTSTDPQRTATVGFSLGGLISFWLCWKYPQVFGSAGCLSTHFPWTGKLAKAEGDVPLIEGEIVNGATVPRGIRFYFDYGTRGIDSTYEPMQNKVNAWLSSQGLKEGEDFVARKFPGADHSERSWRKRVDVPLEFLLREAN